MRTFALSLMSFVFWGTIRVCATVLTWCVSLLPSIRMPFQFVCRPGGRVSDGVRQPHPRKAPGTTAREELGRRQRLDPQSCAAILCKKQLVGEPATLAQAPVRARYAHLRESDVLFDSLPSMYNMGQGGERAWPFFEGIALLAVCFARRRLRLSSSCVVARSDDSAACIAVRIDLSLLLVSGRVYIAADDALAVVPPAANQFVVSADR